MGAYKPVVGAILALGFAAWVVALAGIAEITNDCYSNYLGGGIYSIRATPTTGMATTANLGMNCVRGLNFQWWGVWFEFIILVLASACACTSNFPSHQSTLTGLFATCTAINMVNSRIFMDPSPTNYVFLVISRQSGLNVAAAGYIMFYTFNMILVLLFGSGLVWFKEADVITSKNAAAVISRGPGPNFAQPATFASPLSGGGARAYLPQHAPGEVTISAQ